MLPTNTIRAISLWQPWASLWLSRRKIHETRHWSTDYRGPLVVHAAQKIVRDVDPALAAILVDEFGAGWARQLPTGALIGMVTLTACKLIRVSDLGTTNAADTDDETCGNWQPGRFAWRADDAVYLPTPIPWKGRQGFFNVTASALSVAPVAPGQRDLFGPAP
jgi:hypothetical protein